MSLASTEVHTYEYTYIYKWIIGRKSEARIKQMFDTEGKEETGTLFGFILSTLNQRERVA